MKDLEKPVHENVRKDLVELGMQEEDMIYYRIEEFQESHKDLKYYKKIRIPSKDQAWSFLAMRLLPLQCYEANNSIIGILDYSSLIGKRGHLTLFLDESYRDRINCEKPTFDY